MRRRKSCSLSLSIYDLQQLGFQDELSFLVFFARLVSFVIFPSYSLITLSAHDIPHDVATGCHVSFHGGSGGNVYDGGEEEGFAVLAAKVPTYNVIMIGEMGLAAFTAKNLRGIEVDVVGETHRFL